MEKYSNLSQKEEKFDKNLEKVQNSSENFIEKICEDSDEYFSSNMESSSLKNSEIEQDLESINAILDRYGISPLTKISAKNYQHVYDVIITKEPISMKNSKKSNGEKSNKLKGNSNEKLKGKSNESGSYDYQRNFKKKNEISKENKEKNSYLLSQDYELARPYELEPEYSKFI